MSHVWLIHGNDTTMQLFDIGFGLDSRRVSSVFLFRLNKITNAIT